MLKSQSRVRLAMALAVAFAMSAPLAALADFGIYGTETTEPNNKVARLATYDSSNGETTFALSLTPQLEPLAVKSADVVIYVDTSASQTGAFRIDSLKTVKSLIQSLDPKDRVQLYSLDLDPVAMTEGFVSPQSDEMDAAFEKLSAVTPLGSTDMAGFIKAAASAFDNDSDRPRNAIYIGDGVSRASIIGTERFGDLVKSLTDAKVSVSSFAIGPERDIELLAAIANHTGGNVFIDSDDLSSSDTGAAGLSTTVRGTVFWPVSIKLPAEIKEVLPQTVPPLRSDRDTVIIGSLERSDAFEITIDGVVDNEDISMTWTVEPEKSNGEFSFLPRLVQKTRADGGIALPTVGSAGLREVARVMLASSSKVTPLGAGVVSAANNAVQDGAVQDGAVQDGAVQDAAQDSDGGSGFVAPPANAAPQDGGNFEIDLRQDPVSSDEEGRGLEMAPGSEFIDRVVGAQEARNQQLETRVRAELEAARSMLDTTPQQAIDRMKSMLDIVQRAPGLTPGFQTQLVNELTGGLRAAALSKEEFDATQALMGEQIAVVDGQEAMRRSIVRSEKEIKEWMDTFEALMDEDQYIAAEEVIEAAFAAAPDLPSANSAEEYAPINRHWDRVWQLRDQRAEGALLSWIEIEESSIPFSGNPPIIYPDPEEWAAKVIKRKKWQNVRLTGNQAEEDILNGLSRKADFEFLDSPFVEVIARLNDEYGLPIQVLESAKDAGLTEDETININLSNITIRSGLRILLEEYDCTYVVEDEVLKIVSKEEAEEMQVVNIYNVADLIAPRQNFGGGGGGGGQQGGGGFGGGGQGGGGQGGGGRGGGGGGGLFCVQDSISVPVATNVVNNEDTEEKASTQPQMLEVEALDNETPNQKWDRFFSENFVDPADVRHTVRQLTSDDKTDEALHIMQSAMRNGQTQSWMYHAMILALQINGADQHEIERAVMSSLDMSENVDDMMSVAVLMSKNGMEKRSLQLLQEISHAHPGRVEPYAIGLRAAERVNDMDGIKWASLGVLSQAWPDHRVNVTRAMKAAQKLMIEYKNQERFDDLDSFNKALTEALYRDCIIKVEWSGDADIDLFVEEPGGTVCSRTNIRTASGGVMMGDNASTKNKDGVIAEYYVLPRGFSGDYRLLVKKVWGEITSGKVTVEIQRNYRTPQQTGQRRHIELGDESIVVNFTLENGRRTQFMEDLELNNIIDNYRLSQKALAQSIDQYSYDSRSAANDYILSRGGNGVNGNGQVDEDFFRRRGPVGFQPVITTLPEGTQMSAFAATADRLYVITAPSPFFTEVVSVSTFNFVTGDGGGAGGAGGGAGGLGGAGGGAGGGLF